MYVEEREFFFFSGHSTVGGGWWEGREEGLSIDTNDGGNGRRAKSPWTE